MSATNLSTLTEHINEHELPWTAIHYGTSKLSVQLTSHSSDDLARWVSTLRDVAWSVADFRDEDAYRRPSWHVHAVADLDGDLEVWCSVPEDFGDTAEAVTERMKQAVVVLASVPDPVPAVSEQEGTD